MLRSLGQNPTEEELKDLIDSVDDGDKDGQIQLREFLKLYTEGLDTRASGKAGKEDVDNVVTALAGDPRDTTKGVDPAEFKAFMMAEYALEVDFDALGFAKGGSIMRSELEGLLLGDPIKA